jgi:ketosteroid isomerase-like protein
MEQEMSSDGQTEIIRSAFRAYETEDRELIESVLTDDYVFFSPPDPGIGRAAYFERCWPNAGRIETFEFVRLIEQSDEVVVTYEAKRVDGTRFRNTEVFHLRGGKIDRTEVYFGWDLE